MPMKRTPSGFKVTYSRPKCAVFGVIATVFAFLMVAVGLNTLFPLLDGTPLAGFYIERRPPEVWAVVVIAGGFVALYVAGWNGMNALRSGAAIEMDHDGIEARSLVGCRQFSWEDVGQAQIINGTLFLHPAEGVPGKTMPLQTRLTSVKTEELQRAIREKHPSIFPRSAGQDL